MGGVAVDLVVAVRTAAGGPAVAAGCGVAAAAATEISFKVTLDRRRFQWNGMACPVAEVAEVAEVPWRWSRPR